MTTTDPKPTPGADPKSADDLIETPGAEVTAGGKAPTLAADAAANLANGGAGAPGGDPDPAPAPAAIGRASERAKAGFNKHKTKPQLIQQGRQLAEHAARLELELAQLKGTATPGEDDPTATAVVAVDPAVLEGPLAEVAGVVSDFLAAWRGDHWQFTAEERGKLGRAAAPVVAELAPALGEHATKLTLVLVVLGIAMPRLRKDREEAANRPAA